MNNNSKLIFTFLFIVSVVSFIADVVLNDLSKTNSYFKNWINQYFPKSDIIDSLNTYFKNKGIIVPALYASITVLISTLILILITHFLFNIIIPTSYYELIIITIPAFILG